MLYQEEMKKQKRLRLGLNAETIRQLARSAIAEAHGGMRTGLTCSDCSLSTNAITLADCEKLSCSCNVNCARQ